MSKLVEIKNLYYTAENGVTIFENVDAEFCEGEKVGIIGPLGSGKTTLTRLLLGLEKPQMGGVCLFAKDIESLSRSELYSLRKGIGVVFENVSLISNLKVLENIMLPLQYHTDLSFDAIRERALFLLKHVGYRGDIWTLPGPLPAYTKKTIALARAMTLDPMVMIYDRLLEGLDSYQSLQLLGFVDEFHKQKNGRLSIVIANDERDIKDIKLDRVVKIEGRRIV